jgi:taurine dioxygenase
MKRMLDGLIAINTSAMADVSKTREDRVKDMKRDDARQEYVGEHPVVRTHPETGRKALYLNVAHTSHFKDMTTEESRPIINYLVQHQTRPEFTCRFSWQTGSIAFWDNRCALHNPVNDYHGYKRAMHRVTLAGDRPQ